MRHGCPLMMSPAPSATTQSCHWRRVLAGLLMVWPGVLLAEGDGSAVPEPITTVESSVLSPATGPALAAEPAQPEVTSATVPLNASAPVSGSPLLKDCIRRDESGRFQGWMDYKHCVYSSRATASARWFDELFGEWSDEDAKLMVRIITEQGWDEENGWSTQGRIRASADLPNAKARLRLVIEDEGEGVLPEAQRTRPQALRDLRDNATVALRWTPLETAGIRSDVDVGVRSGPDIYARLRLSRRWGLTDDSVVKVGQIFRYGTESHGVSTSQLLMEQAVGSRSVLRFSNVFQFEENDHPNGFIWSHGLSMSHVIEHDTSLSYGISIEGHTRPDYRKESYGPWLIWRQSVWRDWLYYEIEPRLTRYRGVGWDTVPSLLLRLEAQFGDYKKK